MGTAALAAFAMKGAAEASADGDAGAVGVAAAGDRGIAATTDQGAETVTSPAAVVVAIGEWEETLAVGALLGALLIGGRLVQRLSSTTWLFSSTQRCISGFWQPVSMERAAAARSGAATWVERRMVSGWVCRGKSSRRLLRFWNDFASKIADHCLQRRSYTGSGGTEKTRLGGFG